MTRGPLTFKGTDLKRALDTAKNAGFEIVSFEITKAGSIVVHVGGSDIEPANDEAEWDKALSPLMSIRAARHMRLDGLGCISRHLGRQLANLLGLRSQRADLLSPIGRV
jgi:hypothetical protein